jgi:hypothetical protein
MPQRFANAARALLSNSITAATTSIQIGAGGNLFPVANTEDWFHCVIQDGAGIEIVRVNTHTADSNTFTVVRGQGGTTARSFAIGSVFGQRVTAADMEALATITDIGTAPNEIPLNQYLGSMAYEDHDNVVITGGVATLADANITTLRQTTEISTVEPTLNLNFARSKTLDPKVTFVRASEGRFYDGKTFAKAEENLLLQSQTFETASWTKVRSTVTANTSVAPDGTTTADKLAEAAAAASWPVLQSVFTVTAGVTYAFSVYAKAAEVNFLVLDTFGGAASTWFDLAGGVVGTVNGAHTASITNVGNGWYRCAVVYAAQATGIPSIRAVSANNSTASIGEGNGIIIWGAQLEQRSTVTAYTPTTTQPITNYIPVLQTAPAGVARFDHNPTTGESLGLLIEESRTNLLLRSQEFENAAWTKLRASIASNQTVAPNGTLSADTVTATETNANGAFAEVNPAPALSAIAHTLTVFAKATSSNPGFLLLRPSLASNFADSVSAWFNLQTGVVSQTVTSGSSSVVTTPVASIEPVGNGWFRCRLTFTVTAANTISTRFYVSDASGLLNVTAGKQADLWGAQLEAGAFPTSYIPTVASQVTRSADAASMTGTNFSSWYRQDEGTLYAEASRRSSTNTAAIATFSDGTANNRFYPRVDSATSAISFTVVFGGVAQATPVSSSFAANQFSKVATAYKVNDFAISGNSAAVGTDTSGVVPSVNQLAIGTAENFTAGVNGHIRRIAYYPARLTNAALQALTT